MVISIPGERPRLVGADYGCAAQGLHSRETSDEGSALAAALHADRQGAGHDRRQGFGDGGDGEAHPPDEHFSSTGLPRGMPTRQHRRRPRSRRNAQPLADEVHLHGERGWLLFDRLEQGRDPAELCPHPGGGHDRLAPAIGNKGARKHHVPAVADPRFLVQDDCGVLLHGSRFPGKRGLLGAQVGHVQEPSVRWDAVTGAEDDRRRRARPRRRGRRVGSPPRRTKAVGAAMALSARIARSALYSGRIPRGR